MASPRAGLRLCVACAARHGAAAGCAAAARVLQLLAAARRRAVARPRGATSRAGRSSAHGALGRGDAAAGVRSSARDA
ncbi:hypothetical protein U9M48_040402 [Paspalum notatum var. saurae]|uniref:Uncharacterized protein n=1 Tax=Paspalum notatum var. saurae TaxID=547442 RepID=A0AAQ3XCC9_PASNO